MKVKIHNLEWHRFVINLGTVRWLQSICGKWWILYFVVLKILSQNWPSSVRRKWSKRSRLHKWWFRKIQPVFTLLGSERQTMFKRCDNFNSVFFFLKQTIKIKRIVHDGLASIMINHKVVQDNDQLNNHPKMKCLKIKARQWHKRDRKWVIAF